MNPYDLALGDDLLGDDLLGDDLLGNDGLHGDDVAAMLGGRGKAAPRGADVQHHVMPFPRTSVAAATTTTVTAFPQRKFRTQRFIFASAVAASFTVDELKIGQESMLVQTGNIPAQVFSELGVGVALHGYVATPGITISLTCTNTSGASAFISAAIIGAAAV